MDRQIIYPGQIPLETDLLNTNRNVLIGLGLLAQDIFGTGTIVGGLPCTPTAPASLAVLLGGGRIYALETVDATAYSSLPLDTTDQILKQGIVLGSTTLSCPAPVTPGFAINYLIEGGYQDQDTTSVVLPYYNASNPSSAWSGPNNTGASQATQRKGIVSLIAKAGIPAATGSQATPAADAGYVPLYVVTVIFGQTTVVGGNIVQAPGAPFIAGGLLTQAAANLLYLRLSGGTLSGPLSGTSANFQSLTVNGTSVTDASILQTGLIAAARISSISVTQWQGALSIGWNQITGTKNADQLNGLVASSAPTAGSIAARDAGGNLFAAYLNQGSGNNENPAISQIFVNNGSDGYLRKASFAYLMAQMTLSSIGGQVAVGQVPVGAVTQWQGSMSLSSIGGQVSNGQVPFGAVQQYQSNLAIGWGQITGTKNADQLQGLVPTASVVGSTIMARDVNGYAYAGYFFQTSNNSENGTVSQVMYTNGNDNALRKADLAVVHRQAMLQPSAVTIAADPGTVPSGSPGQVWEYY